MAFYRKKQYRTIKGMLFVAMLGLPVASQAIDKHNVRGLRYCEVVVAKSRLDFSVYSTLGLNDCPDPLWKKITPAVIKKETGAYFVYLNGPRFLTMDGIARADFMDPHVVTLGGIQMREAGVVHLTWADLLKGAAPYREHTVNRKNTWVYKAGLPVYELVDPKGQVFVMQSYSVEKKALTAEQRLHLERLLRLPSGWRFHSGVLTHDADVPTIHDKAIVIQDSLLNTYQLSMQDLLSDEMSH